MKKFLFFIDDDESFLYLLKRTCRKIGAISEIETAENGSDAIKKIRTWLEEQKDLPNMMFIDINMPVMDGFEFLENFKEMREKVQELKSISPVIMLTSSQHASDRQRALSTGIVDKVVEKALGADELEKFLREMIQ